jgi:uncharacterized protein YjiS (DUF1127 family)
MTTIDYNDVPAALPERESLLGVLRIWFATRRRRRLERLTLLELARMDSYLLRDLGIDPMDVRDALDGRNSAILFDPVRRLR